MNTLRRITTDDVCPSNLKNFHYWEKVKDRYPHLRLIAFTIANYRNEQNVTQSKEFKKWFNRNKNWVEIGVHGYDHLYPPECERPNQQRYIELALTILKPFLPDNYIYRPPGFQYTTKTVPILKQLGFAGIAYQKKIQFFNKTHVPVFNTHCTFAQYTNPIGRIWDTTDWGKML